MALLSVAAVTFTTAQDPPSVNVTIPSGTTLAVVTWGGYRSGAIQSVTFTLNSVAAAGTWNSTGSSDETSSGGAYWNSPSSGTIALDPSFAAANAGGPNCFIWCFDDSSSIVAQNALDSGPSQGTAKTFNLTTQSGDFVAKHDQIDSDAIAGQPSLSAGWTNGVTPTAINIQNARASYITASGASTTVAGEDESWACLVGFAVRVSGGGATSFLFQRRMARMSSHFR